MAEARDLREDLDTLKEDVSKLRSDITELTQKLLFIGKSEAGVAKDKLLDQGKRTAETLEKKIEERPLTSILVAFILGLFLGTLSLLVNRK